ncbi:putative Prefoldin chaperone subunit family protein [Melia azedarach]|uniref:Prefoldin chaperone subunit family protein n=1 Tax=Melia azedarach TaxID=155640 RepID=A0ACC1Y733_MELAZ|nr:putative Prefoldin chaperone subunit family protein [Melia azedarach]
MAKKKLTQKSNDAKEKNQPEQKNQNLTQDKTLTHQHSMEDPAEKLQNLKNLNSMLLKETIEKRQQVDSLNQEKELLESQLSRLGVEKSELADELDQEAERNVSLEIEQDLISVFVMTQVNEMGLGLEKEKRQWENDIRALKTELSELMDNLENEKERWHQACNERDSVKSDLDCQVKEATRFKERLIEMEGKELDLKDEILVLKNESGRLMKEKKERGRDIRALKEERGLLERRLVEVGKEIDDLKVEIEGILREKKEIEKQKSEQKGKVDGLEKEVGNLNEIVSDLRKEEKVLHEKVLELEKSYSEAMDKKEEMTLQINALMVQEGEKQRSVEVLMEEKDGISQRLEKAMVDLKDKEGQIAKLLREKNDIEERNVSQESKIAGLQEEIDQLRDVVLTLKESCRDEEEKSKKLENEVRDYKNALDQAKLERDNARMGLDEEKKNGIDLRSIVLQMEKRIEENVEELEKVRKEHENLIEQRKKMESHIGLLTEEKELMLKNLLEAKQSAEVLRAKIESIGINSGRALSMLKNTAAMVCQSENDLDGKQELVVNEKTLQDETEEYVVELEAIKNSFRNKEKLVEDMKKKVDHLQNSVEEAHKKKSFWTVVSSATTLFAAASIAYVAKIR